MPNAYHVEALYSDDLVSAPINQNSASLGLSRSYKVPNESIGAKIYVADTRADVVGVETIFNSSPPVSVVSGRTRSVSIQCPTTAAASNSTVSSTIRTTSTPHIIENNIEDFDRLRSEIVNIRQEMERLREDHSFVNFRAEPPPSYSSETP